MLNICLYGESNPDYRLYISGNPLPHVTVPNSYWSRFYDQAYADGTAFSSVANISSVYAPVAFTADVDTSDTANVAAFFAANSTVVANSDAERYAVKQLEETGLTQAYANIDDPPIPWRLPKAGSTLSSWLHKTTPERRGLYS